MKPAPKPKRTADHFVKDLSLASWGRKEIAIAEVEMPGLIAIREEFGPVQPLRGARIAGSLHMTIQTAVLIETLQALGADVRWASCNIYSTQDHAAAAVAASGVPVFAYKGESLQDYWEFTHRIFEWSDGGTPNMILDDGGDATLLVHLGVAGERNHAVLHHPNNEEEQVLFGAIAARRESSPGWYATIANNIRGVTEQTTTDSHRRQYRAFRFRDPGGGAAELQMGKRQAAGRRDRVPGRQAHHPALRRPAGESRQRHGASELRHVELLHQSNAGADRALHPSGQVRKKGLHAAQAARREGGAAAPRQDRREAHAHVGKAGGLYRRAGRGTLQVRSVPVLIRRCHSGRARQRASRNP